MSPLTPKQQAKLERRIAYELFRAFPTLTQIEKGMSFDTLMLSDNLSNPLVAQLKDRMKRIFEDFPEESELLENLTFNQRFERNHFQDAIETDMAIQLFETFGTVQEIHPGTLISQNEDLKLDVSNPLFLHLKDFSFSKTFNRKDYEKILMQRRMPQKLSRHEIQDVSGLLVNPKHIDMIAKIFKQVNLQVIPKGNLLKVLPTEIVNNLSEQLKKELANVTLEKTVIKDDQGNIYAVSDAYLGRGTFGEVVIAQAILPAEKSSLKKGDFVAMKKQLLKEKEEEDTVQLEFKIEGKMEDYHFGHTIVRADQNKNAHAYSFIKLIDGAELGDWVNNEILGVVPIEAAWIEQFEQGFLDSIVHPQRYQYLSYLEQRATNEIVPLQKELETKIDEMRNDFLMKFTKLKKEIEDKKTGIKNKMREEHISEEQAEEEGLYSEVDEFEKEQYGILLDELVAKGIIEVDENNEVSEGKVIKKLEKKLSNFSEKYHSYSDYLDKTAQEQAKLVDEEQGQRILAEREEKRNLAEEKLANLRYKDITAISMTLNAQVNKINSFISDLNSMGTTLSNVVNAPEPTGTFDMKRGVSNAPKKELKSDESVAVVASHVELEGNTFPKNVLTTILPVFINLAKQTEGIHKKEILHRDIKPGNVMIGRRYQDVTVIDFNTALMTVGGTATAYTAGTLSFLAPEADNVRKEMTPFLHTKGVDIWSVAASYEAIFTSILQELVVGKNKEVIVNSGKKGALFTLSIDNPDKDPSISALNEIFKLLKQMKTRNPEKRKDLNSVAIELEKIFVTLNQEMNLIDEMDSLLSKVSFAGDQTDFQRAMDAIQPLLSQFKENFARYDSLSDEYIRAHIQKYLQQVQERREQKAKYESKQKAEKEQEERQRDYFSKIEQRNMARYELLLKQRETLISDIKEIKERISSSVVDIESEMKRLKEKEEKLEKVQKAIAPFEEKIAEKLEKEKSKQEKRVKHTALQIEKMETEQKRKQAHQEQKAKDRKDKKLKRTLLKKIDDIDLIQEHLSQVKKSNISGVIYNTQLRDVPWPIVELQKALNEAKGLLKDDTQGQTVLMNLEKAIKLFDGRIKQRPDQIKLQKLSQSIVLKLEELKKEYPSSFQDDQKNKLQKDSQTPMRSPALTTEKSVSTVYLQNIVAPLKFAKKDEENSEKNSANVALAKTLAELNQIDLVKRYQHSSKKAKASVIPDEILQVQSAISQAKDSLRKGRSIPEALGLILDNVRNLKGPRTDTVANMIIVDLTKQIGSLLEAKKSKPKL